MDALFLWPDRPALSISVLAVVAVLLLWAARDPMLQLMRSLGDSLEDGFSAVARWCTSTADELRERSRASLAAAHKLEMEGKLEREFQKIDAGFSERLGKYADLHRRLDDVLMKLQSDYEKCGDAPPEVPGWATAVESIAGIPTSGDPNVQKVLEGIKKSIQEAERKALQAHRDDTSKRHKILSAMRPMWKDVLGILGKMRDAIANVQETSSKVNQYIDAYEGARRQDDGATRTLAGSAWKLFVVSLIVLAIAFGGAYINFNLIALPMSELVPEGARVGGLPVAAVSAMVIVLMEAAVGIFIMDLLGVTELFPKLGTIALSRRRLLLGVAIFGLFFLAAVESSLAILREQIVEADAALKLSLAGSEANAVMQASSSPIPVVGQAVLGFILPFILAMVAIPLEMLLDSGRHVLASLAVFVLSTFGNLCRAMAHVLASITRALPSLYDVVIALPLRVERMLGREPRKSDGSSGRRTAKSEGVA